MRLKCPILKPELMTMRLTILFLLLLPGVLSLGQVTDSQASSDDQEEPKGWFAYGYSATGSFASVDELERGRSNYKYRVAKQVFQDLVEASGNHHMIPPRFELSPVPKMIAAANGDQAIILLEEKAYDICTGFGKDSLNAIASLLGHELIHYYEKHNWEDHFIREHGGTMTAESIQEKKVGNKMLLETQADQLGGLLAHTAGYKTLEVAPELLTKLYTGYGLPASSPTSQYPSLDERRAIAQTSMDRLKELIGVYDLAGYFLATNQFDWARAYYEYILTKGGFQSREIYNNLGVAAALSAMEGRSVDKPSFVYPLQLDLSSRMGSRGNEEDRQIALLEEASRHFKSAYSLDPEYVTALINQGCVEAELGRWDDADDLARKALRMAKKAGDKEAESDALILTGIIQATQNDKEGAKASFTSAGSLTHNPLADLNLQVLNGQSLPPPQLPGPVNSDETIDDFNLDKLFASFALERFVPDHYIENIVGSFSYAAAREEASTVLVHVDFGKEIYGFVQVADPTYSGSTNEGIKIGDPVSKVMDLYGSPSRRVPAIQGEWVVFNDQQIIFRLDAKGKVFNWALFRIKRA